MPIDQLKARSKGLCELCLSPEPSNAYCIEPGSQETVESCVYLCQPCTDQLKSPKDLKVDHWHKLAETMWSEHTPVKILAYKILSVLKNPLVDQLYLEEQELARAKSGWPFADDSATASTQDSNGNLLEPGDTVTLIKDLNVKGAGFTAKRGTVVKSIHLTDDPRYIEGKIDGTTVVLVSAYLKKVVP